MKQNPLNPYCARCSSRLKKNGVKNGKTRFRCHTCGYNETENSTAHNSNKRVFPIGYTQLKNEKKLVRTLNGQGSIGVLFGSLQAKTQRLNRETPSGYVPLEKNSNKTVQRETPNTLS